MQNLLFCNPKAAVLHGKSVGFALQNSRFRNAKTKLPFFFGIIFTKAKRFPRSILELIGILENTKNTPATTRLRRIETLFFANLRRIIAVLSAKVCSCGKNILSLPTNRIKLYEQ
ncbi:hypothetical protein CTI16_04130 [Prevotella intermedia]|uniref:Uncharacterized protein n=1 Tax=Prevotella intermedia TaxID=28131 RepID=A0AAJ3V9N5_PREIN|nr:hypothetical protein CTI16_04130 [Prevotella intermedia]